MHTRRHFLKNSAGLSLLAAGCAPDILVSRAHGASALSSTNGTIVGPCNVALSMDYAIRKFGDDHVAIGTDGAYRSRNAEAERAKVRSGTFRPPGAPARWEAPWRRDDFLPKPHGIQSLAWTNWPLFTVGMVQRGHSDETIRKVVGGNTLRVLEANFPPVRAATQK